MAAALRDSEYRPPAVLPRLWIAAAAIMAIVGIIVWSVLRAAESSAGVTPVASSAAVSVAADNLPIATVAETSTSNPLSGEALELFVATRIDRTREWLRQAEGNHFSIQVLRVTADAAKDLERFLRSQDSVDFLDRIFIYQARHNGQAVYGVLYSEFANYADAKAALEALPTEVKRYKPFLRSVRQVRATMDES